LDQQERFAYAQAVAEQIWREQTLTNNRMNWNLVFQGFMIASFATLAVATPTPALVIMQAVTAVAGLLVAAFTWLGLGASERQRAFLKGLFNELAKQPLNFPRPFSEGAGSLAGRAPAHGALLALMVMWIGLLSQSVPFGFALEFR
jgi:hypothetical protein